MQPTHEFENINCPVLPRDTTRILLRGLKMENCCEVILMTYFRWCNFDDLTSNFVKVLLHHNHFARTKNSHITQLRSTKM